MSERETLFSSRHQTADGFEWEAEPDDGWFLSTGERWEGVRVKYRRKGTRRWMRFVIVHEADAYEIVLGIQEHSRKAAA